MPFATARELAAAAGRCQSPAAAWAMLTESFLTPEVDFSVHEWLYETIYAGTVDRPAWLPSPTVIDHANVTAAAGDLGLRDYAAFHQWSVQNRDEYWRCVIDRLRIRQRVPFSRIMDGSHPTRPKWLVGAKLNIVESCFQADGGHIAVIESDGSGPLQRYTQAELSRMTARVASGLQAAGVSPGDTVAVIMPMSFRSIAIYLGVIAAGGRSYFDRRQFRRRRDRGSVCVWPMHGSSSRRTSFPGAPNGCHFTRKYRRQTHRLQW